MPKTPVTEFIPLSHASGPIEAALGFTVPSLYTRLLDRSRSGEFPNEVRFGRRGFWSADLPKVCAALTRESRRGRARNGGSPQAVAPAEAAE